MSEREWRFYVDDMIAFAEKVAAYTRGLDQATFEANDRTYDATLRNLELIVKRPCVTRPGGMDQEAFREDPKTQSAAFGSKISGSDADRVVKDL